MEDTKRPPEPPVRPLLRFDDPFTELKTHSTSFEGSVRPGEIVSLNHIRDMTGQRNIACVREGRLASISPDQVDSFRKYLSNVAYLLDQEGPQEEALAFEWSSPLSGRGGRFFRVSGLIAEQALATFLYAAAHRHLAHQALDDLLGLGPGGGPPYEGDARAAELAQAATLLRKAAGIWEALAEKVLPPLQPDLRGDRPAELAPPVAACMALVALGEAQALAAFRAEERHSALPLVAALHAGAAHEYERAAKVLRDHAGELPQVSERLRRCIALSSSLASARAHRANALEVLKAGLDAGAAGRAMQEATSLLATCQQVASSDGSWRQLMADEARVLEPKRQQVENDRLYVYCQPLAREVPPLPAARVLVAAVPYEVERLTATAAEVSIGR